MCSSDSEKLGSFEDSLRHLPPRSNAGHAKASLKDIRSCPHAPAGGVRGHRTVALKEAREGSFLGGFSGEGSPEVVGGGDVKKRRKGSKGSEVSVIRRTTGGFV
ncbi:hypothetical protein HAX54_014636 [Datura stramonium]|uniref:Uncharacterized protein n=1 Tax=Datura stramonium TaxID=4076 RepID=A0ABS8TND5_DATST|nr:hypothetical protein [Datura stramonium]